MERAVPGEERALRKTVEVGIQRGRAGRAGPSGGRLCFSTCAPRGAQEVLPLVISFSSEHAQQLLYNNHPGLGLAS